MENPSPRFSGRMIRSKSDVCDVIQEGMTKRRKKNSEEGCLVYVQM